MKLRNLITVLLLFGLLLTACGGTGSQVTPTLPETSPEPTQSQPTTPPETTSPTDSGEGSPSAVQLSVMTHDSFLASEQVIAEFERQNNARVTIVPAGDTGAALNQAILSKNSPRADVFYGVDNTFLSRALEADIFDAYASPMVDQIPEEFKLDPQNRAIPVDYGDVCINYDRAYFTENSLAVPQSLEDLVKPEYKNLLVVENPATSSPGLAFLLATIVHFGPDGYLDYWQQLTENGVVAAADWETAYYTNFSASSGRGPQPMVVSYGSSPAAEVYFATQPPEQAPTASIIGKDTCFRQVEFVGILKGTQERALAEKFVDFMLSVPFQEDMPLQMFVFPVNPQAKLPDVFLENVQIPPEPARMPADEIAKNREAWIQAWTETVLR